MYREDGVAEAKVNMVHQISGAARIPRWLRYVTENGCIAVGETMDLFINSAFAPLWGLQRQCFS